MFEKLNKLLEEARNFSLTRFVIMTFCGFVFWLMLIFTLEFTETINIDAACGGTCIWLIQELISTTKPYKTAGFDLHPPSTAPIRITVTFLP